MKKNIISLALALGFSLTALGTPVTQTVTVAPGAFTLLSSGPIKVSQIVSVGTTATNSSALLVDATTNSTTYVVLAYTNFVSYITNSPFIYTNYYGVLSTNADSGGTNWVLVDVAKAVAQATNNLPTVSVGALGNQALVYNNLNTYFFRGIWVTNTGTGNMQITIQGNTQ